eukprot:4887673-Amphidinium_carterae.1
MPFGEMILGHCPAARLTRHNINYQHCSILRGCSNKAPVLPQPPTKETIGFRGMSVTDEPRDYRVPG